MEDPNREWDFATITTYGRHNHAVQTRRHRFYRYEDGAMELYDQQRDPNEWHNLAGDPDQKALIESLSRHLPADCAEPSEKITYPTNEYFLAK